MGKATWQTSECWRSHRKKYLASLAKLKSVLSIEPDICPKAERVCSPNDFSCCFIIRDLDGGSAAIFLFGTGQPPGLSFLAKKKKMLSCVGELMFGLLPPHCFCHYFLDVRLCLFLNPRSSFFQFKGFLVRII